MSFAFEFFSKCAPSTSFYMPITTDSRTIKSLQSAGFSCSGCHESLIRGTFNCYNCTFCATGFYSDRTGSCVSCPAGIYKNLILFWNLNFSISKLSASYKGITPILLYNFVGSSLGHFNCNISCRSSFAAVAHFFFFFFFFLGGGGGSNVCLIWACLNPLGIALPCSIHFNRKLANFIL